MNWIFRKLMKKLVKDFELAYKTQYELTHDENMRPDMYWLQKYLNNEL